MVPNDIWPHTFLNLFFMIFPFTTNVHILVTFSPFFTYPCQITHTTNVNAGYIKVSLFLVSHCSQQNMARNN